MNSQPPISPAIKITGVKINYYYICHTKLWLFSHNITFEHEHENVKIGKLLHEDRYSKNKKDVTIDNTISIDFVKQRNGIIELHEIKKTKKMEDAHLRQMLYYLYYLKQKGIDAEGIMNYPLLKQYLNWVQNSVFEGELTKAEYLRVRLRLMDLIDEDEDCIFIYSVRDRKYLGFEELGTRKAEIDTII